MTHEEIKAAIRRMTGEGLSTYDSVMSAFMGTCQWRSDEVLDTLISLLNDADVDEWPDETLDYHGLMRLPVDANGEPICIGDIVYKDNTPVRVTSIHVGTPTFAYADDMESNKMREQYPLIPEDVTHIPPSVEDLLSNFWVDMIQGNELDRHDIVVRYAKIIRDVMS